MELCTKIASFKFKVGKFECVLVKNAKFRYNFFQNYTIKVFCEVIEGALVEQGYGIKCLKLSSKNTLFNFMIENSKYFFMKWQNETTDS